MKIIKTICIGVTAALMSQNYEENDRETIVRTRGIQ